MDRVHRRDVTTSPGPLVAGERMDAAPGARPHSHDFAELVVVTTGSTTHVCAAGRRRLARGSVVALRPGDWHGYDDNHDLCMYNIYVGGEIFERELSWIRADPRLGPVLWPADHHLDGGRGADRTSYLEPPALRRVEEWLPQLAGRPSRSASDHVRRVGMLLCVLSELATALGGTVERVEPARHPAVAAATRLLGEHVADRWSLEELAGCVHLSVSYLVRLFAAQVGMSPMTYLGRLRAERAAGLLLETDLPVAEIGRLVGWHDPNYASRRFRQFFADSPAGYRARMRAGSPQVARSIP